MRYLLPLAGALALAACGMYGDDKPSLAKGPLDDKTYSAQLVRDGQSRPVELVFEDGTFRSTDPLSTQKVTYTAYPQGEFMKFEAVTTSPKSGTMKWSGTIRGEEIDGVAVWDAGWWRPDRKYTFKGTLKDD